MDHSSEASNSGGLRRRSVGQNACGPNIPLNLQVGFKISDGGVIMGTPSPSGVKIFADDDDDDVRRSNSMAEFRKKQQSFEIHIEDCDEEEMSGGSSDEGGSRPITPVPPPVLPDFGGSVVHKEQAPQEDFLKVGERDDQCLTDVSEGESENEEEMEEQLLPENSVIKRVPS